jgi:hypothetical protein
MKRIIQVIAATTLLSLGTWATLFADEEKEESLSASSVPAAVQRAAEAEAQGGSIVRWEKEEDNNYEAVIEKNGKQTGIEFTVDGKVVSRHDEAKEHKEKGEKGEE